VLSDFIWCNLLVLFHDNLHLVEHSIILILGINNIKPNVITANHATMQHNQHSTGMTETERTQTTQLDKGSMLCRYVMWTSRQWTRSKFYVCYI